MRAWLLVAFVLVSAPAAAVDVEIHGDLLMRIDNHYYLVDAPRDFQGNPIHVGVYPNGDFIDVYAFVTTMGCVDSTGAPYAPSANAINLVVTEDPAAPYFQGEIGSPSSGATVAVDYQYLVEDQTGLLSVRTTNGGVVCSGTVARPASATHLFRSSFE